MIDGNAGESKLGDCDKTLFRRAKLRCSSNEHMPLARRLHHATLSQFAAVATACEASRDHTGSKLIFYR